MKLSILLLLLPQASPTASDTVALATALGHAREVIEEGEIQVSPGVGQDFWGVDERSPLLGAETFIAAAALQAGLAFGPDEAAIECPPAGGCRGLGAVRGLVHVWDYRRVSDDAAVVRIRILSFTSRVDWIYEEVSDVFVERAESDESWVIVKVDRLSVT